MVVGIEGSLQGEPGLDFVEQHLDEDVVSTHDLGGIEHELDVGGHGAELEVGPALLLDGVEVGEGHAAAIDVEQTEERQEGVLRSVAQVGAVRLMADVTVGLGYHLAQQVALRGGRGIGRGGRGIGAVGGEGARILKLPVAADLLVGEEVVERHGLAQFRVLDAAGNAEQQFAEPVGIHVVANIVGIAEEGFHQALAALTLLCQGLEGGADGGVGQHVCIAVTVEIAHVAAGGIVVYLDQRAVQGHLSHGVLHGEDAGNVGGAAPVDHGAVGEDGREAVHHAPHDLPVLVAAQFGQLAPAAVSVAPYAVQSQQDVVAQRRQLAQGVGLQQYAVRHLVALGIGEIAGAIAAKVGNIKGFPTLGGWSLFPLGGPGIGHVDTGGTADVLFYFVVWRLCLQTVS